MRRVLGVALVLFFILIDAFAFGATDQGLITTPANEVEAVANTTHLAWIRAARGTSHYNVFVRRWGGSKRRVNARRTEAWLGSIVGGKIVYQQYRQGRRGYSDIYLFDLSSGNRTKMGAVSTRYWEYDPKMTSDWLMFVRLNLRDGKRTLYLRNRNNGNTRRLARVAFRGHIEVGQINGRYATWLEFPVGQRSRVHVLHIPTRTERVIPSDRYDWAPSVTAEGTVYFGRTRRTCGSGLRLMRWEWQGGDLTTLKRYRDGLDTSSTSVYLTPQGQIRVLYERARCSNLRSGSDIYRYADDFAVKLTVVKDGAGEGTVRSDDGGIRCGQDCLHYYEPVAGNTVTLRAFPAEGDSFSGWSDPDCPGTGPCTVTMTQARTITATFSPSP